jgi:hypothetical protein
MGLLGMMMTTLQIQKQIQTPDAKGVKVAQKTQKRKIQIKG